MGVVLLTQAEARNRRHAAVLAGHGVETLSWPLLDTVPAATAPPPLDGVEALLVTSAHAVEVFAQLSPRRDLPVLAVGDATAAAARRTGFADVASAGGTVEDLAGLAGGHPARRFLYLRGREVSADLPTLIGGKNVAEAVLYATEPSPGPPPPVDAALSTGRIGLITVWSPRAGAALAARVSARAGWRLAGCDLLAISRNAGAPLADLAFRRLLTAENPSTEAMLATILAQQAD